MAAALLRSCVRARELAPAQRWRRWSQCQFPLGHGSVSIFISGRGCRTMNVNSFIRRRRSAVGSSPGAVNRGNTTAATTIYCTHSYITPNTTTIIPVITYIYIYIHAYMCNYVCINIRVNMNVYEYVTVTYILL